MTTPPPDPAAVADDGLQRWLAEAESIAYEAECLAVTLSQTDQPVALEVAGLASRIRATIRPTPTAEQPRGADEARRST